MGVLVADSKTFNIGLTLTNFVISIKGCFRGAEKTTVLLDPLTTRYRVWYNAYYYANQAAYNANAAHIEQSHHELDLTAEQIAATPMFDLIYADIKSRFTSTTDI